MSILPFNTTILLWPLNTWSLMYSTKIKKKLMTRITMELKGIIWSYNFDCSLKLSANKLHKLLKCRQSLRFVLQHVRPCSSSKIINKSQKISKSLVFRYPIRSPNVHVNHLTDGGTFAIPNVIREPCKFGHGTCHTCFIVFHLKFQLWLTLQFAKGCMSKPFMAYFIRLMSLSTVSSTSNIGVDLVCF